MRYPWWSALTLTVLIVGATLGAGDQDALVRNRHLLERWRVDPDHHARLQRDLRAFYALPRPRQEQLRAFDRQLHETDAATQTRLWAALERYNVWLGTLTEEQRGHIAQAPDAATRLSRIREQRLREWMPRLTTGDQQAVNQLPEDQQPDRIATIRFEDRRLRAAWHRDLIAAEMAIPRPTKLAELPAETKAFVEANLMRRLTGGERAERGERAELRKLEGKYPDWLRRLDKMAEMHPVLPPLPSGEVKSYDDLVKIPGMESLKKPHFKFLLGKINGPWPEFALKARAMLGREKKIAPLGASQPSDFSPEIQAFLKQKLFPVLTPEQRTQLTNQEKHWPEYPMTLHRLARDNNLIIPGMSLPGPMAMWEDARAEAAVTLDGPLPDLAKGDLTAEGHAQKGMKAIAPAGNREKIQTPLERKKGETEPKSEKAPSP